MKSYKNYFFDLYGTLVDIRTDEGRPSLWRGMAEFCSMTGAPYSATELKNTYLSLCAEETDLLAAVHPELGTEHVEIELRSVFRRLYAEKGADIPDGRVDDMAVLFRVLSYRRAPRLMPYAKRVLETLRGRGARVFLLSNAQRCFTAPELERLGIVESFDAVFISSDFGCKKPAGDFFRAALERAGAAAAGSLMIGNDPDADMLGASRAGMDGAYIHTWQSPPRRGELPAGCVEIASLPDLLK